MIVFCSVHLVELIGSGQLFAMKAMDKSMMLNRNKVYLSMISLVTKRCFSLLDSLFTSTRAVFNSD